MNKKYVRVVAIALALLVALAFIIGLVIPLISPPAKAESALDALRENAQALDDAKKQIQQQLDQLAQDKAGILQTKAALDQEIELTVAQIENTNQLISQLNLEIADHQTALEEAVREEAAQMDSFRVRIRLMEESGEAQYLGVLLQADSFPDLLGRLSSVQDIMDYDQKMLAQLRDAREKVETEKQALEQNRSEMTEVRTALSGHQADLEAQEAEQQSLMDELESKESDLLAAEAEQDRQEELVQQQIQDELARLEAERIAQQQQNGSSGGGYAGDSGRDYVGGEFLWPCPSSHRVTSPFGWRYHPILHTNKLHTGIDIGASSGSQILAANAGVVIKSEYNTGGYGNYVVIDHGGGRTTLYAHMSKRIAVAGQHVERGETIGLVGSTGMSTGPHLHFEVSINGTRVDPMQFF